MSQNINLYDPSLRERRDLLGFEPAVALVCAVIVCAALGGFAARWSLGRVEPLAASSSAELEAQQAAAQALAERAASGKRDPDLQAQVAAAQRHLLQRRAALQALDGNAPDHEGGFSSRLEALARQSVDGLWLTGMEMRYGDVLLKGRTLTPSLIPLYVQRLDREPSLQGHAFKALDVSRPPAEGVRVMASAASASDAAAAPRAEYVEFALVGAGGDTAPADKELRP